MANELFTRALTQFFGSRVHHHEPLAPYTTFRLGGPAALWLPVHTVDELVHAVTLARAHTIPMVILGGGGNLLIGDSGFSGLVIQNRTSHVDFPPTLEEGTTVTIRVDSGVILPNLANRCAKRGLHGFEWAVGIPGTIGGAVVNNAGAYGSDMAQQLVRAELLSPDGERIWQPPQWFEYRYRASRLKYDLKDWVVLQAELHFKLLSVDEVMTTMRQFNHQRKNSQPPGATIGSMFKNPPDDYAGRLIEAAGLRGYKVGQAQISPIHANFFQNLGGASADEVLQLIHTAHAAVLDKFGIDLELEIEVIGDQSA